MLLPLKPGFAARPDGIQTATASDADVATAPAHVYTHRWQVGELVIYDNRCTMHRLRRYNVEKEQRVLRRVATLDMANPARDPAEIERALQGATT
jgi:alpha-ketoglutarate-dependent 2,4-dichlorophenoxyacetate dioxygenase